MSAQVDLITRKKLILVKQLYQQAVVQSAAQHSYVSRIMSLIGFDLAAETALKAVVAVLDPSKSVDNSFQSLIQQADKLMADAGLSPVPDKANIQHVHSLRNDAQHKAKYPNETDISDCRTYVRDFLQKIIADLWGLSFEDLSLADAVQDEEVKEYLLTAEGALENGDYTEALLQAETGFRMALELVEAAFVGRLDLGTSAFVTINNYDEDKIDRRAFSAFKQMRESVLISTLGLNVPSYWRYEQIVLSVINYSTSIATGETEVLFTGEDVDQKHAEFVVAYAINAVVQIESLVGDLDAPFGITW